VLYHRVVNGAFPTDLLPEPSYARGDEGVIARDRTELETKSRTAFLAEMSKSPEAMYEVISAHRSPSYATFDWGDAARMHGDMIVTASEASSSWGDMMGLIDPIGSDGALTYTSYGDIDPIGPEPEGVGEMWWGETSVGLPGLIGMYEAWDKSGLRMFGQLQWDDGDLLQAGYHVYSSFYLDRVRMPASNRVRSQPGGVLAGEMFGWTGGSPFAFSFSGDQWSKCRLRLSQRAWAVSPSSPADAIPVGSSGNELQIIDLEGDNDYRVGSLPGGIPYAPLDLVLDRTRTLRVDLEIELFIQLEGDVGIRFGGIGHSNPALHQPSQWTLIPL
jgi:hypothetical protein